MDYDSCVMICRWADVLYVTILVTMCDTIYVSMLGCMMIYGTIPTMICIVIYSMACMIRLITCCTLLDKCTYIRTYIMMHCLSWNMIYAMAFVAIYVTLCCKIHSCYMYYVLLYDIQYDISMCNHQGVPYMVYTRAHICTMTLPRCDSNIYIYIYILRWI